MCRCNSAFGSEDNAVSSASVESGGICCEFTMPIEASMVLIVASPQHNYRAARQVLRLFGRSGLRS